MKTTITSRKGKKTTAFRVRFTTDSGEVKSQTFSAGTPAENKAAAEAFAADQRNRSLRGYYLTPDKTPTLTAAFEEFDRHREKFVGEKGESFKRGSLDNYRSNWRCHIEPFLGKHRVGLITIVTLSDFEDHLREKGCSPNVIKTTKLYLSLILKRCIKKGLIETNPVDLIKGESAPSGIANLEDQEKVLTILEPHQITELIEEAGKNSGRRKWLRTFIILGAHTGLRGGELRGLRWFNITINDDGTGQIKVTNGADRFNQIGSCKTPSAYRTVPFGPFVGNTLREWKATDWKENDLDLVLPSERGTVLPYPSTWEGFTGLCVSLGWIENCTDWRGNVILDDGITYKDGSKPPKVKSQFSPHDLRHFCISNWIRNGLRGYELTEPAGHADEKESKETYGHLFDENRKKSHDVIREASESVA